MSKPIVAVVFDGAVPRRHELLRAIAFELAARGVCVVVAGRDERVLAEIVGEIAFRGGQSGHVVGTLEEGASRAEAVFGSADFLLTITILGTVDMRWREGSTFFRYGDDPAAVGRNIAARLLERAAGS